MIKETRDETVSTTVNETETVTDTFEGTFDSDKVDDIQRGKESSNDMCDDHFKPETEYCDSCSLDDSTIEQPYENPAQHQHATCR